VTLDVECPDVSVVKTAADPVISSTQEASFSITVDGGALGTSDDVILTDELPSGFSWTVGGADINACSDDAFATTLLPGEVLAGGTLIECNFGTLDPDETKTITLTATTAEDDCDLTIANMAVVSTAGDAVASNNSSRATVRVDCPDLDITKTADDELVSAGERIGFVITVRNRSAAGTGTAFDVTLADPLPQGNGINWRIADELNGDLCTIDGEAPAAETLECEFGDLEPGTSRSVHVVSDTTLGSCETHPNTATVDADNHAAVPASDSLTVECPGLNIAKEARAGTIDAGETAIFDIVVWNTGPGTAFDVTLTDELPGDLDWAEDSGDCSISEGVLTCDFGDLGVATKANSPARVTLSAETDRSDCGVLDNEAIADSDPGQPIDDDDSITVRCPTIGLEKENDAAGSVLPGTTVTYTLRLTVIDGPAQDVVIIDTLPGGLEDPTNISDGGQFDEATATITWELGDLADGTYTLTYQATVADDVPNGAELVNAAAAMSPNSQCPDLETLGPECEDDSVVVVRDPTLVIDKVASVEVITISGPANDQTASPSVVTWTLSYTLSSGPVTNAVITDVVPIGLVYVAGSASDGGTYDSATRTLTWNLGTLTASGSVTFRTRIDVESISRTAPTVNIAIIDSTETEPDSGQDDVRVVVQPPPAGGNPRPRPRVPDTAMAPPAVENEGYVALGAATLIASLAWAVGGPLAAGRRREHAACHAPHDARDK
jgi:fimbrial isopeptide formation D2 family protein/uncharacterized repeat protein (TIGR01451 family)